WITLSPTCSAIASMFSFVSLTNTPTFLMVEGRDALIFAAFSGFIFRLLSANTNPIKSAPASSACCAASSVVMPHILTCIVHLAFRKRNTYIAECDEQIIRTHQCFSDKNAACAMFGYLFYIFPCFYPAFTDQDDIRGFYYRSKFSGCI